MLITTYPDSISLSCNSFKKLFEQDFSTHGSAQAQLFWQKLIKNMNEKPSKYTLNLGVWEDGFGIVSFQQLN
jgi:hypothetical protein